MRTFLLAVVMLVDIAGVFIPSHVFAQDYRSGYIIKNSGDSLKGFVHYARGNTTDARCSFKVTKDSEPSQFSPSEAKAFGIYGDNEWISMITPADTTKKVFVRELVTGPISLYRNGNLFLLKKQDLIELPEPTKEVIATQDGLKSRQDNKYVGILNSLVADCGLSANLVKYTESQITNLVHKYNQCKGSDIVESKRAASKLNYGLSIGYLHSSMSPQGAPNGFSFSPGNSVFGSLVFDYSAPRVFDHLFLTMELQYLKTSYSGHFQVYDLINGSSDHAVYDLTIDTRLFRIPIGLKYNFLTEKSTPYIKVGYTFSIAENVDASLIHETTNGGNTTTTEYNEEGLMTQQPNGPWIAFGYNQLVSKKAKVFLELRYEQTSSYLFVMDLGFSKMKNFTISTGIRF